MLINALAIEKLFLVTDVSRNSSDCSIELWLDRPILLGTETLE